MKLVYEYLAGFELSIYVFCLSEGAFVLSLPQCGRGPPRLQSLASDTTVPKAMRDRELHY
jgi:hypothetical protein